MIGGGVSHIGKPLFDKIRATIPSHTINGFAASTPVLPAKLRTNVGVYGAAAVFLPAGEAAESYRFVFTAEALSSKAGSFVLSASAVNRCAVALSNLRNLLNLWKNMPNR